MGNWFLDWYLFMYNSLKNIPYYIFIFLLFWAPLAFGSVELWSLTVMEALCFAAALIYFNKSQNREKAKILRLIQAP